MKILFCTDFARSYFFIKYEGNIFFLFIKGGGIGEEFKEIKKIFLLSHCKLNNVKSIYGNHFNRSSTCLVQYDFQKSINSKHS